MLLKSSPMLALLLTLSSVAFAGAGHNHDDAAAGPGSSATAESGLPLVDGEVKKVDKEAGKLTLKHGPITNLGMPAMTMVFRVKDPAMLERVKKGDKIRFSTDNVKGAMTVVQLESATVK